MLIGTALLTFQEETALLAVLILSPLLQWVFAKVAGAQIEKKGGALRTVPAVLSFIAVSIVVRMGLAVSI
ncbi:hypothetical protein FH039_06365 [Thermococcus indicus]|uniref:Uncharacterized protein n=1 Tax=Thermococcus indicus TaxID=2586643 RepID=A0A4Y5SLN4_9EURY|nr:hypothetical protein [Thermococcus indicus]QDA31294.1 hypothetical protein FH039_06365 [Thermococcus indicus]